MKRIGICTLYFNNRNYGANLQAYALRHVVCKMGYEAEVISYYYSTRLRRWLAFVKRMLKCSDKISRQIFKRESVIDEFNKSIPHSKIYYVNTIYKANKNYDVFITGSDQVWNPDFINKYLSLEFVDYNKTTIAYAASTGKIHFTDEQVVKLISAIEHTKYISIRELDSIPALQKITNKNISLALDPTLLLSSSDWDQICSKRLISNDYLFCYFLSDNENLRIQANRFASSVGLKIVTLPYLNSTYRKADEGFGDYLLYDVSPRDFLSLIKYASFVITDSFHAAVFSLLFERKFIVSGKKNNQMNCRIRFLAELFGTEERYCDDHEKINTELLEKLYSKPTVINWSSFESVKAKSLAFLESAIYNG